MKSVPGKVIDYVLNWVLLGFGAVYLAWLSWRMKRQKQKDAKAVDWQKEVAGELRRMASQIEAGNLECTALVKNHYFLTDTQKLVYRFRRGPAFYRAYAQMKARQQ